MLTVKMDPVSDTTLAIYHLAGEIDESADFSPIVKSPAPDLTLNFGKVTSVNSFGIRKMMQLLQALKGRLIRYEDCPVTLTGQFNIVAGLVKDVDVLSFRMPYECTPCDWELEKRVLTSEARQPGFTERLNTMFICDRCSRHLTFMDDESMFLLFLENLK